MLPKFFLIYRQLIKISAVITYLQRKGLLTGFNGWKRGGNSCQVSKLIFICAEDIFWGTVVILAMCENFMFTECDGNKRV